LLVVLTATATIISYRWASDMVYKVMGAAPPGAPGVAAASPPVEVAQPPPGTKALGYEALVAAMQKEIPNWEQITIRFSGTAPGPGQQGRAGNAQPVSIAVREQNGWPLFTSLQLSVDPFTGTVLKKESYADYNSGRKVRTWMRFLHTGEALGIFGKLVAGLASLGGAVLVWTGVALAMRRLIAWRRTPTAIADTTREATTL
jgi:uncharacterized iron-regulated membrane protein